MFAWCTCEKCGFEMLKQSVEAQIGADSKDMEEEKAGEAAAKDGFHSHQSIRQAMLSKSITNAIDSIIHLLEREEIDRNELEKCILRYFNQAAKGLVLGQKTFKELVNDYADVSHALGLMGQGRAFL